MECGVSLLNSLNIHTNPRQHSKLALVAKTLGILSNMILLFLSKAWPKTRLGYFRYQQYHYERIHLATTYSITKKMGSLALQENISKNEEYFENLRKCYNPTQAFSRDDTGRSRSSEGLMNSYEFSEQKVTEFLGEHRPYRFLNT